MNHSEINNSARGPWTAFAIDGSGEILVDVPLEAEYLESIVVVRGSAMPVERDGILCLPEAGQRVDVLYEKEPYELPVSLAIGSKVLIEGTGAYTTTYSAVGFNGFPPLKSYVI